LTADPAVTIALDRSAWEALGARFTSFDDDLGGKGRIATARVKTERGTIEAGVLDFDEATTYLLVPGTGSSAAVDAQAVVATLESAGAVPDGAVLEHLLDVRPGARSRARRPGPMKKTDLVAAIAKDSGLTKADARKAVESLLMTVEETLKKGDDIALTGFGKFSVAKRSARTGRNPQTGETVKIKASKAPKFTAGASLKTAVTGRKSSK
jgi:DNA-binding protein HU-beta